MSDPVDVIITWGNNSLPSSITSKFQRPTKVITLEVPAGQNYSGQLQSFNWPHPVRQICLRAGVDKPLRICAMGFSESCQGVMGLMRSADAAFIEHAISIDGIHGGFIGPPNADRTNLNPDAYAPTISYAELAARGQASYKNYPPAKRFCTITHSSIVPPFPSTTETARWILNSLFPSGWPTAPVPDAIKNAVHNPMWGCNGIKYGYTTFDHAYGQHGLKVLGYKNNDPAGTCDHIYQAQIVRKLVIENLLVPRWNAVEPTAKGCNVFPNTAGEMSAPGLCDPDNPVLFPTADIDGTLDYSKYGSPPLNTDKKAPAKSYAGVIVAGGIVALALGIFVGTLMIDGRKAASWF